MIKKSYATYNGKQTAELLDFPLLVEAIKQASLERECGVIRSPERMVIPMNSSGVMLSMPATANDISIHKLVNVNPDNHRKALPTIHGQVAVFDSTTGVPLLMLDGPEVTGRRTAAVSMVALQTFLPQAPSTILMIGSGVQALYHLRAINALFPKAAVWIKGQSQGAAISFCSTHREIHPHLQPWTDDAHDCVDAVITLTTSTSPVYDKPAVKGRLIIGVGAFKPEMAEIGQNTLSGSDVYVDDLAGARHEAGDLIQAGVDWNTVLSLASVLEKGGDFKRPVVFKSVGSAAWDLAACRVALSQLAAV
jgi:1-piperideine-2-carboxylate/1-pyrroline-2-carboxylate reductase [NAD(P)H]